MGTTSDKLLYLQSTKSAIKDAIVAKGVDVPTGTSFRDYASKIGDITTGSTPVADEWVRPAEWLALPDNVDGVQKVSILNAVFDTDSEYVAFTCQSSYTVNWGDGVVENFASGVKAEHKYYYSNVNLNSDTVAKFGYKQCVITITPQDANNLTSIKLSSYNQDIGSSTSYDLTSGFLDIRINASTCTTLAIGANSETATYVKHSMLEQCIIGELIATDLSGLFYDCYVLQSVSIDDTSNVTSFANMHYNNHSLRKMPTYTFKTGVICTQMFYYCYSLYETYPLVLNTASVTSMFVECRNLTRIDLTINSNTNYSLASLFSNCSTLTQYNLTFLGSGKITSLSGTFTNNYRMVESPAMDTSLCTSFNNTFTGCVSLVKLYDYNYSSAISLSGMLTFCINITKLGNFNTTTALITLNNLCTNMYSLVQAPTFNNTANVTSTTSMFSDCRSLKVIPAYNFPSLTSLDGMFINCSSLVVLPNITYGSGVTTTTNFLTACYSLKRVLMPINFTFSVANAKMSATALNEMYTALPTVTGKTVTVNGNYGTSGDNPAIATAKGWTVTG